MKNKELNSCVEGLKKVKTVKFEDKQLRSDAFQVFMAMVGAKRAFDEKFEDAKTFFLSKHKDEQEVVNKLQQRLNYESNPVKALQLIEEIESHKDYKMALDNLNDELLKLGNAEVKLKKIDMAKFMEEYQKQDDFDLAVVEAIYPMFETTEKEKK